MEQKTFVVTVEYQEIYPFDNSNLGELLKEAFKTDYSKKFYDDVKILKVEEVDSQGV